MTDSTSSSGPEDRGVVLQKPASEDNAKMEIGKNRFVMVREFRGRKLIDLREYYLKDDELKPGKKGISLTVAQFRTLSSIVPKVEEILKSKYNV